MAGAPDCTCAVQACDRFYDLLDAKGVQAVDEQMDMYGKAQVLSSWRCMSQGFHTLRADSSCGLCEQLYEHDMAVDPVLPTVDMPLMKADQVTVDPDSIHSYQTWMESTLVSCCSYIAGENFVAAAMGRSRHTLSCSAHTRQWPVAVRSLFNSPCCSSFALHQACGLDLSSLLTQLRLSVH